MAVQIKSKINCNQTVNTSFGELKFGRDKIAVVEDEEAAALIVANWPQTFSFVEPRKKEAVITKEKEVAVSQEGDNDSIKKELNSMNVPDLKVLLEEAEIDPKEFKDLKKEQLIELIIEKNIL